MAACGQMSEFTEKQELKEGVDWHAICTVADVRCMRTCASAPWPEAEQSGVHVREFCRWWSKKSDK